MSGFDPYDEYDDPAIPVRPERPPLGARVAGLVWLLVGAAGVVQGLGHFFVNVVAVAGRNSPFGHRDYAGCCAGHLFAAAFLALGFGVGSGRSAPAWVLVGAALSLVFGLACGCLGFAAWSLSRHIAEGERAAVYAVAAFDGLQGVALLVAGLFAAVGYPAYATWLRRS
jgi:hypothetical protein